MLTDGLRFLEGSTNTNLVLPVVTSAGKAALSANAGEVVFQSDGTKGLYVYDGIQWVLGIDISAASSPIAASRLPAFTGDVTSTAGTSALTLAASGVTAGTFKSVTVNAKGLVTAGTNPTTLSGYGITDAATNVATSITSGTFDVARLPAFTGGDVTAAAGSTALVLANSGVTAGTFKSVTVNAKGLVTAGTNPTTLSGYGITNAYTKTEVDTALTNATGGVVTFAAVTAKPTTISGYGILDAYTKSEVDTAITNATPVLTFASLTGKPTTLAGYGITDGVLSTDVRLTDARTPLAHTHVIADVTDLQTSLDAKVIKNADIVAGTAFKITYDAKGLVTAGAALTSTDIPALSTDAITSGVFDATRLPADVVYTVAGALPSALVPTVSLTGTITPNTYADLTAATAASATGTVGLVTADSDLTKNGTYVKGTDGTWKKLNVATNNVASINGKTGNISKILPEDILGVFATDVNKTLLSAKLPLFTGDVVSTSGARSTLTLNTIPGLTVGANYSSVTVNAKGLVTGGIVGNNYTTVQADAKFVTKTAAGAKNAANGYLGLNATGKIEATYLPLFDGDIASTAGARNILTLKNISGLAAGTYSSVTVNAKGLVTGGTNGVNYTKVEADAKFLTKAVAGGRNVAEGFAGLNSAGKIDATLLPAITVNEIQSVTTIVERDALTGLSVGDMAIVGGSVNKTFILSSVSPNTWVELLNPVGGVTSINGNSGVLTIDLSNIPGTLTVEKMPIYTTGDVITNAVSNDLELKTVSGLTAGSYSKVTVNTKGIVTAGTNPTTIADFGITDAYTKTEVDTAITNATPVLTFTSLTDKPTTLAGYGITDAVTPADITTAIDNIKASVPTDGDNLKKLYDLIVASFKEIVVADIAARDLYDVTALPTNVFVTDDGDSKWALYKATTTGVGATFVKLSDPDLLNVAVAFTPENVADKSIDGTLAENSDTKYPSQKAVKTYADTKVTKNTDIVAGTGTKITYDEKGLVTVGEQLAATDIPNLSWNKIATDKPTTLTGFGITDAYTKTEVDTAITNATPTLTFTSLTDKPTTLAGYGITDTVATLENGKIPSSQLPSFVDDVQEFANLAAFPATGETGKIYVALDTNLTWRWSGSVYLQVSGPTTDASVLVGGTLNALRLPAFTGDVTSIAGTSALTLANSGVTAGTYNSVTVNAKGIVTAAGQSAASKDLSTARTITLSENLMLTDTSKHIQTIITTQPGLEVILPDATNFPIGGIHFVIKNDGYMTFNVADRIGNWICEVRPSSSVAVLLSDNVKNQYNYTENSVAKTGYAGEWVTVIGNATRPSGLIIGDETRLVSSTITNVGATPLSLTKAIVTYVTGNVAYVALLSNSQLVNTIATPVSLGAVTNSTIQIEALSSSIALVTYQTSAGVKVSKLSYDGTTLTVASTATVYNNTALDHKLVKVSTTSAVVSYVDAANALKLLTISDALTLGTVNNFGTIGNEFDITFNNNKLLLVYLDTNLKSSVGTISSGVITFGASTEVTAYAVSKIHLISTDTNTNLCAFYSTGFVEYVQLTMDTYVVNSVYTNVIFVGDIVKVKGAYVSDIALTSTYNKNVVLSYKTTNGKLEIVDITINANTVSVNNINTLVNSFGGTVEVIALYEDSIICVYSGLYDFLYVV